MTVAFGSAGAKSAGGTSTITVEHPASIAAGDILLAGRAGWPATSIVFSDEEGWTLAGELGGGINSSNDNHTTSVRCDYKQAVGEETGSVTFDQTSANGCLGVMYRYTKASDKAWEIAAVSGADGTHGTGRNITATSAFNLQPGDVIVVFVAADTDTSPAITGTNFSLPGVTHGGTTVRSGSAGVTTGQDGNIYVFECTVSTGTNNVTPTLNFTTTPSTCGPAVFVRLREVDPPPTTDPGGWGEVWQ